MWICSWRIVYIKLHWCTFICSVGISAQRWVGGGSIWLCWEFREWPVLSTGRFYLNQPPYWFWVELRPAQWQRGNFPQGFCWEHRYKIVNTVEWQMLKYCFNEDRYLSISLILLAISFFKIRLSTKTLYSKVATLHPQFNVITRIKMPQIYSVNYSMTLWK